MLIRYLVALIGIVSIAGSSQALASQSSTTTEQEHKAFDAVFGKGPQEEDVYRTDRLLLTATGSLKPIYRAPSVANVITAEDIEKVGARTLYEAMEMVPGLHVGLSTVCAVTPIISLRGIHTSINPQVLIMINGIPISQFFSGSRGFLHMPVAGIARIEVVRGPGSAVFGADAFSGTVNIITKEGRDIEGTTAKGQYGSFNSQGISAQHGSAKGPFEYFLNLEYMKTDGDKDRVVDSDLQSILDNAMGTKASLAPKALDSSQEVVNANLSVTTGNWTFRTWGTTGHFGVGDGVTNLLSSEGKTSTDQYLLDLQYRNTKLVSDLDFNLRLSHMYIKQDSYLQAFPQGALLPIGADGNINFNAPVALVLFPDGVYGAPIHIDRQTGIDLTGLYEGLKNQRIRLGAGFRYIRETHEEIKNFGPGAIDTSTLAAIPAINIRNGSLTDVTNTQYIFSDNSIRRLWYSSIQDEWSFARKWELTAGVRYDHYSDFGDTINPRLALVWDTRNDLTTKILYGKAFRPPSGTELYAKNNPTNNGNPNLAPEKIQTGEFVLDYQPAKQLRTVFNTFYYEIKDLIELVQDPGATTKTSQNAKDQQGYGFELEAEWEITNTIQVKAAYAYQRSKDKEIKALVADAPQQKFLLNPRWEFLADWSLDTQLYIIADRPRASGDTRPEINDYELVNLILRKKDVIRHWDMALGVKNVFNEDVREPANANIPNDYPMEGRSIYAEVQARF